MTLVNGSFEAPVIPVNSFSVVTPTSWTSVGLGEIWHTPFTGGLPSMLPYPDGLNQLTELDGASQFLEQTFVVAAAAGVVNWSYYTHARNAANGVELQIGNAALPAASNVIVDSVPAPGFPNWVLKSGAWAKPAGVTSVRFRFNLLGPFSATGVLLDGAVADFVAGAGTLCNCGTLTTGVP